MTYSKTKHPQTTIGRLSFLEQEAQLLIFGENLRLPTELATRATAVIGIRDSGKTNTGVVACEELQQQGQQIVIIDPLDGCYGLKSSADGQRPAYPVVILGGRHGDVPLNPTDGPIVADFVVDEGASVILSLRHFESQADQRRLVTDFARRIFYRKGEVDKQTPLLIVIDECSLFIPQRVNAAEAPMVGAIQKLVRQGRSSGIGVMLIDQRPASINKDVLSQIELLIAHRCTSPHDMQALMRWVEQHDTEGRGEIFKKSLSTLSKGTAWVWSPGWLDIFKQVKIRLRKTFDSSATPKMGEVRREPKVMAEIDLEALKSKLAATIERAKEDDPDALKSRIRELEDKLKNVTRLSLPQVQKVEIERVPAELYRELLDIWQKLGLAKNALESMVSDFNSEAPTRLAHLRTQYEAFGALVEKSRFKPTPSTNGSPHKMISPELPAFSSRDAHARRTTSGPSGEVSSSSHGLQTQAQGSLRGERRVIFALRELGGKTDRVSMAVYACYKESAGAFRNILSSLRSQKLVEDRDGLVCFTSLGEVRAKEIGHHDYSKNRGLLEEWKQKLGKPARLALDVLASIQPDAISPREIAERTGYVADAGAFRNGLSELRSNHLVETAQKKLRLSRVLA